jgi:hypothetical protein
MVVDPATAKHTVDYWGRVNLLRSVKKLSLADPSAYVTA